MSLNATLYDTENGSKAMRFKRMSLSERKNECEILGNTKTGVGLFNDLLGDIPDIPIIGTTAKVFLSGFKMIGHLSNFGLTMKSGDLECDSIPFDEIKEILDQRFNEVDRKLDKLLIVLENISEKVSITLKMVDNMRIEMNEGFARILETIESQEIKFIVNKIDTFIRYFENERERIQNLPQREYVFKLEEKNSILEFLKDSRTPKENSLHSALFEILDRNNNFAIADDANDTKAFMALYALYYGSQTYVSVMFFLLKQYSYLADYYYQNSNTEKFNKNLDLLKTTFDDFKFSLVGPKNSDALIEKVVEIINKVENSNFIENVNNELYSKINKESLLNLQTEIKEMELDMIVDTPEPAVQISFKSSKLKTPFGKWKKGSEVSYAVQLMSKEKYSRMSDWSIPTSIKNRGNPILKFPVDPERRTRLIFRRFGLNKPHLAGVMNNFQVDFNDIDRDLYDAARNIYELQGFKEVGNLIKAGANITAVFELGRTVLHAAAESGNLKVAELLFEKGFNLNIKDHKGYSALHIAAASDQSNFTKFLLDKGADVNAQTDSELLTASHIASKNGFIDTLIKLKLSPKLDVNLKEKFGLTSLHYAIQGGASVVKELLSCDGIDVNVRSHTGLTPLHLAVLKDDQEIVDILIKTGKANINEGDDIKTTPLHFATVTGNLNLVHYLLSLETIKVNSGVENDFWTPLNLAIFMKKEEVSLELLKNTKVNIEKVSKSNITTLHLAVTSGMKNVIHEILKKTPNMEVKMKKNGYTPLHLAVSLSNLDVTTLLLQYNANINTRDNDNSTPLHLAAETGTVEVLIELLNHKANTRAKNKHNQIPVEITILKNDAEKFEVFTQHGLSLTDLSADDNYLSLVYDIVNRILRKDLYDVYRRRLSDNARDPDVYRMFEKQNKLEVLKILRKIWGDHEDYFYNLENNVKDCFDYGSYGKFYSLRDKNWNLEDCYKKFQVVIPTSGRSRRSQSNELKFKFNKLDSEDSFMKNLNNFQISKNLGVIPYTLKNTEEFRLPPIKQTGHKQSLDSQTMMPLDANGTLIFLDMIIRKLTNEKYKPFSNGIPSDLELRARALNLTEEVRKSIETIGKVSVDEFIDFANLHSQVYKSLKNNNQSNISKILGLFLKSVLSPQEVDGVIDNISRKTGVPNKKY